MKELIYLKELLEEKSMNYTEIANALHFSKKAHTGSSGRSGERSGAQG